MRVLKRNSRFESRKYCKESKVFSFKKLKLQFSYLVSILKHSQDLNVNLDDFVLKIKYGDCENDLVKILSCSKLLNNNITEIDDFLNILEIHVQKAASEYMEDPENYKINKGSVFRDKLWINVCCEIESKDKKSLSQQAFKYEIGVGITKDKTIDFSDQEEFIADNIISNEDAITDILKRKIPLSSIHYWN